MILSPTESSITVLGIPRGSSSIWAGDLGHHLKFPQKKNRLRFLEYFHIYLREWQAECPVYISPMEQNQIEMSAASLVSIEDHANGIARIKKKQDERTFDRGLSTEDFAWRQTTDNNRLYNFWSASFYTVGLYWGSVNQRTLSMARMQSQMKLIWKS